MNELHLFAGAGGGILGGYLLGHRCVCAVEIEEYPRKVLLQRQLDGILPKFPIWDDITTFDGKPWRGVVDVVCGGFPCQDISCAGKGAGIEGERSGLWGEMSRVIDEVRPQYAFVENSPMLTSRGLGRVLGDLAEMGYNARWGVLGADDVGAPHKRKRIWILAYARCKHGQERNTARMDKEEEKRSSCLLYDKSGSERQGDVSNSIKQRLQISIEKDQAGKNREQIRRESTPSDWWSVEPQLGRVANGVANRVDRLKSIGNGQVPRVAELAWRILNKGNDKEGR